MRARLAPLLLVVTFGPSAHARPFLPFGGGVLKGDDLGIVTNLTGEMNAAGRIGTRDWSDPATGSSGTVALVRGFRAAGLACHEMKYVFHLTDPARRRAYTLNWCRTPQGAWRIKS